MFPSKPNSNGDIIADESVVEKTLCSKTGPAGFVIDWKMGSRDCEEEVVTNEVLVWELC